MAETTTWPPVWAGLVLLVAVAFVYDLLLWTVRRADRAYPSTNPTESTWWFGYARDLANLAGFGGFAIAFRALGFSGPRALLAGVVFGLVGYGLDYAVARKLGAKFAKVLFGATMLAMIVVIVVLRRDVESGMERVLRALF